MKKPYLFIIVSLVAGLAGCKKNNANPQSEIVGKWFETKLTISEASNGHTTRDTAFAGGDFTPADYYLFNNDNTALISQSGVYNVTGKSMAVIGGAAPLATTEYKYQLTDSTVLLNAVFIHPTNGSNATQYSLNETIVQLDAAHLVLRSTYSYLYRGTTPGDVAYPINVTTTAYFIKK